MFPSTHNSPVSSMMVPKSPACLVRGRSRRADRPRADGDANTNAFGWVPVGPLCSCLPNQVDILTLGILLCGEKKHREDRQQCRWRNKGFWLFRGLVYILCTGIGQLSLVTPQHRSWDHWLIRLGRHSGSFLPDRSRLPFVLWGFSEPFVIGWGVNQARTKYARFCPCQ